MIKKKKRVKQNTDLDVASFFDGVDEFELQGDAVSPDVDTRDGADDNIHLLHGVDEAVVVGEGCLNEVRALFLEGEKHLKLLDLESQLCPLKHVGLVPLC